MQISVLRIAALLSVSLLLSCEEYWQQPSFVDVPKEHSYLIDGIHSYLRVSEARELLGGLAAKWEVIEDSGQVPSKDSRPPFRFYTVLVREYEHLGFKGDLKLMFFNDRLMSSVFYPNDFAGYVQRVSTAYQGLTEKTPIRVPPFTEMALGIDYQKRKYVSWEDVRLIKEWSIWIKRYS